MEHYLSIYPGNSLFWKYFAKRTAYMIGWFRELGGTASEIISKSGLASAYKYVELKEETFLKETEQEEVVCKKWNIATEVYVHVPGEEELDHVLLFTYSSGKDSYLSQIGKKIAGRQVVEYAELYEAAGHGYDCILCRESERNGKYFARYHNIFGDRAKLCNVTLWSESYAYSGNGRNKLLFMETESDGVMVRPDLYAVQTCAYVIYAEEKIRERLDPAFSIERIDYADPQVLAEMKEGAVLVFLLENHLALEDFPECYQRLAYQTAYLKHYYAKYYAYAIVEHCWEKERQENTERKKYRRSICERLGVKVLRPDINHSEVYSAIGEDNVIYEGFESGFIGDGKVLSNSEMLHLFSDIIRERKVNGLFLSSRDLIRRLCRKNREWAVRLEALSRAYCFDLPDGDAGKLHYAIYAEGYNFAAILDDM